ncbi:hypothetical protein [Rhodovarius lipocyclicus]|uniref:hypothetical protein n=1 Tax=Rhodovarius lipocyclicus TaxID=268410 RepID=UPI0013581680|nr:hypothetical protein [Rhodovarius lipocyclicus]
MARWSAPHGVTLAAGQVATTGTCVALLEVAPGDEVSAEYGVLGRVGLRFAPA